MSVIRTGFCLLLPVIFLVQESACDVKKKVLDCGSFETCAECLQNFGCVWCIEPSISETAQNSDVIHCYTKTAMNTTICRPELLVDPPSIEEVISQKPLQSIQGGHVQVTPQRVKLSMRLGEERKINFQYAQAKNYPIDLYYIMDLSASMENHREKLGKLGNKLARTMMKITNNFRIGFGSFVDKVAMPFVSTVEKKLKSPCTLNKNGEHVICVSPYSFKNHMTLDSNHTKFSIEVSQAKVSGNLDTPEGGFDAIMQAIVCKKEIGWRDQARHLLVFSTDADFHIAGDGKLVGVIEPNDARCHMTDDQYDAYLTYDYPSVSHLNYIAKKNNINLIFAIAKSRKNALSSYLSLTKNIENSNVGALDDKSENVIDLVLDNYNKIVDSVIIDVNSTDNIDVKLTSNCSHPKDRGCSDIHVGEVVNFTATIKPLTCTGYNGEPITIVLKPEGIDENVTIEIDLTCGCACERPSSPYFVRKSEKCSRAGDLVCGACSCPAGRYGSQCECDGEDSHSYNETSCIEKPGALACSGLGRCKCGKCECYKRPNENEEVSGKFCQCDNYSCEQEGGLLCAGHGECSCGICRCNAGWGGPSCKCLEGNSTCIQGGKTNSGVCSGKGVCRCGKCECETYYTGKYCEECPTCKDRCEDIKDCVECKVFKSGQLKRMCDLNCTEYHIEEVDELTTTEWDRREKICRTIDEQTCTIIHRYYYDADQKMIIEVLKKKSCPPNALVWTLGVVGTIVLAGLIMLLSWKIFTTIHDKREYVKFENERKKVKWHTNENPLYKDATTTFQNPCYKS
ncbi:integrin beta-PS-like [Coccinella septempunctata]|uniref:integrin beta-PS-like n=1 Tax=Coccinella septempunctata TaxID=41139 RepID=UPI001D05F230|nr:integrin beta-PS-like [Coccinella septempunctata]